MLPILCIVILATWPAVCIALVLRHKHERVWWRPQQQAADADPVSSRIAAEQCLQLVSGHIGWCSPVQLLRRDLRACTQAQAVQSCRLLLVQCSKLKASQMP